VTVDEFKIELLIQTSKPLIAQLSRASGSNHGSAKSKLFELAQVPLCNPLTKRATICGYKMSHVSCVFLRVRMFKIHDSWSALCTVFVWGQARKTVGLKQKKRTPIKPRG